jgi:hypothetical protein
MADDEDNPPPNIPPDLLDFFRRLRDLADGAVNQLEAAAAGGGTHYSVEITDPAA